MSELHAVDEAAWDDNVKRAGEWKQLTGGTIEVDEYNWHVARNSAGKLLGRRLDLGQLVDFLERR
jgi:hypothetical protein